MRRLDAASLRRIALHVLGVLLILAGVGLSARAAHDTIAYRVAVQRHGGERADGADNAVQQEGSDASTVRVAGMPAVLDPPTDPLFGLKADTPVLIRHVEMFQWREMRLGSEVSYEMGWMDQPIDASHFAHPAGHANPASFPIKKETFDAGLVRIGRFRLSSKLMRALPGSAAVPPEMKSLPANMAASFGPYKNYLTSSAQPDSPRVGDLRVSWEKIPLQEVTVLARADGDKLVAATDAADRKGYDIEVGNVSLTALLPDMPMPPRYLMVKGLVSLLLAALGAWVMLVARRRRRDPLLALGLGALLVGLISMLLWLGHDVSAMAGWLLVSAAGAALAVWRLQRHKRRTIDRP